MWAESVGIVKGFPNGTYAPNAPVTREQVAAILQRYAQWKGWSAAAGDGSAAARFADFGMISNYARNAMQWVTAAGIMKGDPAGRLNPQSQATRAEIAAMLMNFDRSVR